MERNTDKMKRHTSKVGLFLLILLDARIASGKPINEPMIVPTMDICMVSINGEITFGK